MGNIITITLATVAEQQEENQKKKEEEEEGPVVLE